jgi:diaminohydroxyphosphoribosylaminopyrimidine deaminase/5-amino-6-(5-phosphoribosylamino)uracil reductase
MAPGTADARFLAVAFTLAARGLGRVWPNPAVGCVIERDGRIVGRGWTQPGGRPHAEAMALAEAGEGARGATAFTTLEPCAHHGRAPPCADALVSAGIVRLVSTIADPDPRVSGSGFARLRAAGIAVAEGRAAEAAARQNRGFLTRLARGRPMVTLKLGMTLDGRIATARGESRWITGAEARRYAHLMRANHDAVLVGSGTARADDPLLDVRDLGLEAANPVRIVADGGLALDPASRLVRTAGGQPLWVAHRPGASPARAAVLRAAGAELIECPAGADGRLDLAVLLHRLGERGITRLLCEGGGRLAAGLVAEGLADRIATVSAGLVLGGDATAGIAGLGIASLGDAPVFRLTETRRLGADLLALWETPAAP